MRHISVIIPTYNRANMVCDCVDSVLAQKGVDLEVIVVDDCSPDDTGQKIKERFGNDGRVRYMRNEKNSFQAVSRNNGAKVSKGEYFLFLDDDNLLDENAANELIRCFERHPDAGLVAPLSIHLRPGRENVVWMLGSDFNRWTSQPKDVMPNTPAGQLPKLPIDRPTTYSPNAFLVSRKVFEEVGGFDETYEQFFEESDFGWKIIEAKYTAWIATLAVTKHLGFIEPGCVPALRLLGIEKPYRTFCFARNRIRFARRHFSFVQALSVAFIFAPLSAVYYGLVALKNKRYDIAWAYLKGTVRGILGV
jgi:GT2 family glycosyltransferase